MADPTVLTSSPLLFSGMHCVVVVAGRSMGSKRANALRATLALGGATIHDSVWQHYYHCCHAGGHEEKDAEQQQQQQQQQEQQDIRYALPPLYVVGVFLILFSSSILLSVQQKKRSKLMITKRQKSEPFLLLPHFSFTQCQKPTQPISYSPHLLAFSKVYVNSMDPLESVHCRPRKKLPEDQGGSHRGRQADPSIPLVQQSALSRIRRQR